MSELKKTIIIPDDDATNAEGKPKLKISDVVGKPILKMVVLGDSEEVATFASHLAEEPPTAVDRHVIWYKEPDHSALKLLFKNLDDNIEGVLAFAVSTKDIVADYVRAGEKIGYTRIDLAYSRAGLSEFN